MGEPRLYLFTPPAIAPAAFAPRLAVALEGGPVAAVALRLAAGDAIAEEAARHLVPLCHARGVPVLLCDDLAGVRAAGADGLHLGDESRLAEARRRLGAQAMIGAACGGSRDRAIAAGEAGADYVAFGPFFPAPGGEGVDPEILGWWQALMELPCVAAGGITPETAPGLITAGADFIAVARAVWEAAQGPAAALAAFDRATPRPPG